MITISINGRDGKITSRELVTSGSVGMSVSFTFSAEWNSLTKAAVFKGGGTQIDMLLTQSGSGYTCQIPYDVLANANTHLMIGAYGTSGDGSVAIPTVWMDCGIIEPGAVPSGAAPILADRTR